VRKGRFIADGRLRTGTIVGDRVQSKDRSWPVHCVRLAAPVRPGKIICLGRNYADHARELGHTVPEEPLLFFKPPTAVIGPGDPIILPPSSRVDYEGELAVVIGRRCRNVPFERAERVIFGYTCLNDVTDREAQGWEQTWVRAKGFDTSCPIGPWVVTPDELRFPLEVRTHVNGQLRQVGDTSLLHIGVSEIIAAITSFMTLNPGDVIATGTPSGVGPLNSGDIVTVSIGGIGQLENPVR